MGCGSNLWSFVTAHSRVSLIYSPQPTTRKPINPAAVYFYTFYVLASSSPVRDHLNKTNLLICCSHANKLLRKDIERIDEDEDWTPNDQSSEACYANIDGLVLGAPRINLLYIDSVLPFMSSTLLHYSVHSLSLLAPLTGLVIGPRRGDRYQSEPRDRYRGWPGACQVTRADPRPPAIRGRPLELWL